jgi:hypothetical protein
MTVLGERETLLYSVGWILRRQVKEHNVITIMFIILA